MRKILWIICLGIISLAAKEPGEIIKAMETKTLHQLMQKEQDDLYVLDIREPDQIGHGEIFYLNLVTITRGYLEFKIEKEIPNKNANIVIYCCTGKRGKLAAKTLTEMGYTNASYLVGGIRKWVDDGYPLDTTYGEMILKK